MSDDTLTLEQVRHVARLAALSLTDQELVAMRGQLGAVLEYVAVLDELDVAGIEPTAYPVALQAPLRDDQAVPWDRPDEFLEAAPLSEAGGFAVPRVLDGD